MIINLLNLNGNKTYCMLKPLYYYYDRYLPIIPLCLVNGSSGIGTGWSTDVPSYNHREIVQLIKERL